MPLYCKMPGASQDCFRNNPTNIQKRKVQPVNREVLGTHIKQWDMIFMGNSKEVLEYNNIKYKVSIVFDLRGMMLDLSRAVMDMSSMRPFTWMANIELELNFWRTTNIGEFSAKPSCFLRNRYFLRSSQKVPWVSLRYIPISPAR